MIELHAIVLGRVHGVCFRATTCDYAKRLGIVGTVCNLADGSVEIHAQGKKDVLEELLLMLQQEYGVEHINDIKAIYKFPEKHFTDFRIIH